MDILALGRELSIKCSSRLLVYFIDMIEQVVIEEAKKHILTNIEYTKTSFVQTRVRKYIFSVKNETKEIYFFGTSHINDPNDELFDEIKKEFDSFGPDMVFIEGVSPSNFGGYEKFVRGLPEVDLKRRGETSYVAKLALSRRDMGHVVDLESPEPPESREVAHLERCGFTRQDIFKYYFYRFVVQFQRSNNGTEKAINLSSFLDFLSPIRFMMTSQSLGWSEDEVKKYKEYEIANLELEDLENNLRIVSPIPQEGRVFEKTNEISDASGRFRDEYILERLAEGLKNHNKMFIVYGYSHAVMLENAIKYLLRNME